MTVLMTGCGDLGTEAGLRFATAGHRVVGWRRSPDKLPASIEGVAADLTTALLPPIPADTTAVVVAVAADSATEDAYRAAYVDGLANVLDALEHAREHDGAALPSLIQRLLFVSTTAVYGDARGGWVDESTTPAPGGFSGRIILEAEELLLKRLQGTGLTPVVLRLGGIYGPGRTRLIDQVRGGSAVSPAEPRYTNRIHRDDAAAAIVHLCTMAADPDPVYLGVDNDPAELGDVQRFLAAELGLPQPPSDVPGGGPGGGSGGSGGGEQSRGGNKRCSNALLRSTGFEFAYPTFREGYRAILAGEGVRHP
jgi:nucleoside-diphosphate-sugar epimerase